MVCNVKLFQMNLTSSEHKAVSGMYADTKYVHFPENILSIDERIKSNHSEQLKEKLPFMPFQSMEGFFSLASSPI